MLATLTALVVAGAMAPTVLMESVWMVRQLIALLSFIIKRILLGSSPTAETEVITLVLPLLVLNWSLAYLRDAF